MPQPLQKLIDDVASLLAQKKQRIVFAESCTAGLVSAIMARVPGISDYHCGSAVVYRLDTKSHWLGIPASLLIVPGPVSEPIARLMAEGVLERTPEAGMSAAITGHLGPHAPIALDGLVYIGIAVRGQTCRVSEHRLLNQPQPKTDSTFPGDTSREQRQWAAAELVLTAVAATLKLLPD